MPWRRFTASGFPKKRFSAPICGVASCPSSPLMRFSRKELARLTPLRPCARPPVRMCVRWRKRSAPIAGLGPNFSTQAPDLGAAVSRKTSSIWCISAATSGCQMWPTIGRAWFFSILGNSTASPAWWCRNCLARSLASAWRFWALRSRRTPTTRGRLQRSAFAETFWKREPSWPFMTRRWIRNRSVAI